MSKKAKTSTNGKMEDGKVDISATTITEVRLNTDMYMLKHTVR